MNTTKKRLLNYVLLSLLGVFLIILMEAAKRAVPGKPIYYLDYWLFEDKTKIALQSKNGKLVLCDTQKGFCTTSPFGSTIPLTFATFSPNGNFFFCLESPSNSTPVLKLFNFKNINFSLIPFSESYFLDDSTTKLWNIIWLSDDRCLLICALKKNPVRCAHFLQFFLLDLEQKILEPLFKDYFAYGASRYELSKDEKSVLSQGEPIFITDDTTLLYKFSPKVYSIPFFNISHLLNYEKIGKLFTKAPIVANAKWLPGRKIVVLQIETLDTIRNGNSEMLFWDLEMDDIQKIETPIRKIKNYFFTDQGNRILAYGENISILVLDTKTKNQSFLTGHSAFIEGMLISPEGDFFVSYDALGDIVFWQLKTLKPITILKTGNKILKIEKTINNFPEIHFENERKMIFNWHGKLFEDIKPSEEYPKRLFKMVLNKIKSDEKFLYSLDSYQK